MRLPSRLFSGDTSSHVAVSEASDVNTAGQATGFRATNTTSKPSPRMRPKLDNDDVKKLSQDYKKEIKDLWASYALKDKQKNCMVGVVSSTKCAKSITVTVTRQKLVPKYNKFINTRKKFMAHDPDEKANVGDLVRIIPCIPKSKKKHHILLDIIKECGQLNFGKTSPDAPLASSTAETVANAVISNIEEQRQKFGELA